MQTLFSAHGPWLWIIAGVVLLVLEVLSPGVFMLWLGLAALVVGVLSFLIDWSWQWQGVAFVVLAAAAFPIWRRISQRAPPPNDQPFLNQRGEALVGRVFTLEKPIVDGHGTIVVDDTIWRAKGPDLTTGSRVRVARTEGALLIVEAAPG